MQSVLMDQQPVYHKSLLVISSKKQKRMKMTAVPSNYLFYNHLWSTKTRATRFQERYFKKVTFSATVLWTALNSSWHFT